MSFEELREKDQKYIANTYNRFPRRTSCAAKARRCIRRAAKNTSTSAAASPSIPSASNDEEWKEAVIAQINRVQHASNLYYTRPQAELAAMLCERTGAKNVFFSNSGAEANECAIKAARKYSYDKYGEGRYHIVTLKNSFHGRTMATLSATGQDAMHRYFMPFLEGFSYAEPTAASVRAHCSKQTCAVLLELVQGEGGVRPLDKEEVLAVERFCKKNDILLMTRRGADGQRPHGHAVRLRAVRHPSGRRFDGEGPRWRPAPRRDHVL